MHVSLLCVFICVYAYTQDVRFPCYSQKFVKQRERNKEDSIRILAMSKAKAGTTDHFFKDKPAVIMGNVESRSDKEEKTHIQRKPLYITHTLPCLKAWMMCSGLCFLFSPILHLIYVSHIYTATLIIIIIIIIITRSLSCTCQSLFLLA